MAHAPEGTINRYYDPSTGQFVSVDPMVNETNQPYLYAGDDPVNAVDPDGLSPCGLNPFCYIGSGIDQLNNALETAVKWTSNQVNANYCQLSGGQGGGLFGRWLSEQAGCGVGNQVSASSSSQASASCPLFAGALNSGSSADEARAAANNAGYDIPSDYVATPAGSGKGWVFSSPDALGDQYAIRVMEPTAKYPDGYVRTYNSQGYPTDAQGNQIGGKGVGQEETHFPLPPDEVPFEG
jgi:hypothetical protein